VARPHRSSAVEPQVDEPQARLQATGDGVHLGEVHGDGRRQERVDPGLRRIVAQEVGRHPVRHAKRPGQRGPVGVLDQQQSARHQRRERPKAFAVRAGAASAAAPKLQRQAHARAATRDVVVEVPEEAFETWVEVGSQGNQQQLEVDWLEVERAGEVQQPDPCTGRHCLRGPVVELGQQRGRSIVRRGRHERAVGACKESVHLRIGDVETPEAVLGIRVRGTAAFHGRADTCLQQAQAREQVRERRVPWRPGRRGRAGGSDGRDGSGRRGGVGSPGVTSGNGA